MATPLRFDIDILTLYPDAFPGTLDVSILKRAREQGIWSLSTHNIRDASGLPHNKVDDPPTGGGAGLVLRPDVLARALDPLATDGRPVIFPSPRGVPFSQALARRWSDAQGLIFICGRFEGVDERFLAARNVQEVSLGDYILAGGEVATMTMAEAVLRLLAGVTGNAASLSEESFENGLLEYPQYTKPKNWEGLEAPQILFSGNHKKIAKWRLDQSKLLTEERRTDLWADYQKISDMDE